MKVLLSAVGDPAAFAAALATHAAALSSHRSGPHGVPAPVASPLVESLVTRISRGDPHPDAFEILPYEIVDDTPRSEEEQRALDVLRETLGA